MAIRNRTFTQKPVSGFWVQISGSPCSATYINNSFNKVVSSCTDDTAPGDNHSFSTTKSTLSDTFGCTATGRACPGQPKIPRIVDYHPQALRSHASRTEFDHLSIIGKPTNGALAAELLAKTNPSRPVVDLPIAIAELRELPLLFKGYGDGFLKAIARGNLSYQFGIKPMISDLLSLLDFADEFAKREREIEALAEGNLRRKKSLFKGTRTSFVASLQTNSGSPGSSFHSVQRVTKDDTWGFVRWKPTTKMPKTSAERKRLARRAVLGLTVDFSTFWNLMPWTWLIDWTSSAGDFLLAQRNIIPATPHDISIMTHLTTESKLIRLNTTNLPNFGSGTTIESPIGDYTVFRETKSRSPSSPTLSAHLPILSLRQLSILASIGVSKYRG